MNILFLTENFPPETNAAATRVYERACYWIEAGHQVTVITSAPNFPEGRLFPGYENRWRQVEDMSGIRVVRVKTFIAPNLGVIRRTLDFLSFMVTGVGAGLFEDKPDVIAATSPQFFAAVAGWLLGAMRRVPFVFELGDLWPASIAAVGAVQPGRVLQMVEKLELHLYARAEAVVALTGAFKENLVDRGVNKNKIAVIPNGVDLWRYGPRDRGAELARQWNLQDRFVIGYVGTHGMAHGLGNVLDAAEKLIERDDIRFLLAGAGAERDDLVKEAERRNLRNVVFMPPQPKDAMPGVWSLCDAALVHLKNDPVFAGVIPSKMFEAMAMGLPVLIAAPAGEASRILLDDNAGVHVPAQDPNALAEAVEKLADDAEGLKTLADNSLAAAPSHSREYQARHMAAVLEGAAARLGNEAAMQAPSPDTPGDRS
ncbi:MAG: glycosyltransferase family 4 protein [Alphaproteobacteria bacterium]|nr:glycosyltransferase family 4 protein [Alphaproteobacteria bacterium]MBT7943078.1 glycosyltransferase family 4 protein [Alphaproteobacteria bacterium]